MGCSIGQKFSCTCPIQQAQIHFFCEVFYVPVDSSVSLYYNDVSGSGSSSYGGDSEDSDWAPPPVVPDAGGGGDGVADDDEDIDELLSEAKDFISNKKMMRKQ